LEYVDRLTGNMANRKRKPARKPRRQIEPLSALKKTLREHYRRKRAYYTIHWPASDERNLFRIFSTDSRHHSSLSAAQFLRHIRSDLTGIVARGTGVHHYTINHIVRHMIVRCRALDLHLTMPEEEARKLTIITLTMQVMQVLRTGYHRIPL